MGRRIHGPHTEPARSDQVKDVFLEEAELGKGGWNGYENKERKEGAKRVGRVWKRREEKGREGKGKDRKGRERKGTSTIYSS